MKKIKKIIRDEIACLMEIDGVENLFSENYLAQQSKNNYKVFLSWLSQKLQVSIKEENIDWLGSLWRCF